MRSKVGKRGRLKHTAKDKGEYKQMNRAMAKAMSPSHLFATMEPETKHNTKLHQLKNLHSWLLLWTSKTTDLHPNLTHGPPHLTIPPMGLRPEEMMNPRAVAYKIPARYKVSAETFLDAAAESLSIEINPTNGPLIDEPFISAVRHPGTEFDRIELVYHETIDAFKVSATPIVFKKTAYPPLSSTIDFTVTKIMFSEYQFHTSGDAGDNLCVWVKNLLEVEKPMGKVISIQIPMRSSPKGFQVPNHQVFVYVKGNTTPEAAGLGRQHFLPHHQRNPIKVHWTAHGDPNFCNYCKSEGHVLAPAPFDSLLKVAKAATVSSRSKGGKAVPSSTSGVAPPAPAEPLSPSTSLSPPHNAVLSPIVSPSPSPPLPFSEQEFSPTVLSLVSSPGFIPGTPENELFDVFSEYQGKEVVRNDNNKRFFHDSSANTSVTSVLQQVGTGVTQKYMKRASSQASTTGGSSGYMSSPSESQVFTKQKKEGLFQSMGKSVKKTVSKIVSPSPTPTVRRSVRSRVFTQKTKPSHQ
ncbi:hypothetical protein BKA57DRAFT_497033 [Linnemannia elongata]|nr:hypothetical protein BKA57DRAFT_497033 [Linnemannia elongata]